MRAAEGKVLYRSYKCGFSSSLALLLHCHGKIESKERSSYLNIKCQFSFFFPIFSILRDKTTASTRVKKIGKRKGCEETQGLQTTGSSGQRQVTDTQCCLEQQQALLGEHKQGLTPKPSFKVSEKFQVFKN